MSIYELIQLVTTDVNKWVTPHIERVMTFYKLSVAGASGDGRDRTPILVASLSRPQVSPFFKKNKVAEVSIENRNDLSKQPLRDC